MWLHVGHQEQLVMSYTMYGMIERFRPLQTLRDISNSLDETEGAFEYVQLKNPHFSRAEAHFLAYR